MPVLELMQEMPQSGNKTVAGLFRDLITRERNPSAAVRYWPKWVIPYELVKTSRRRPVYAEGKYGTLQQDGAVGQMVYRGFNVLK